MLSDYVPLSKDEAGKQNMLDALLKKMYCKLIFFGHFLKIAYIVTVHYYSLRKTSNQKN